MDGVYWLNITFSSGLENPHILQTSDRLIFLGENKNYYLDLLQLRAKFLELDNTNMRTYVSYNGYILGFEVPPIIENNRTLIPLRFLLEEMGAEVGWFTDDQMIVIQMPDGAWIEMTIDNPIANVMGEPVEMDVPPRIVNNRTMIPLRFVSEGLGFTVDWNNEHRIATIISTR
jgi:hypothetical protein